ncbi:MAG TPA: DUF6600 domain-containing protein [Stellaceae bacterium]|nr:DUF6600 domain-containing protein [Stellaceae bacterium]
MRPLLKILTIAAAATAAAPALAAAPDGPVAGKGAQAASLAVPPARVGRVSAAAGGLSFRAAGETRWSPAGVNYPVAAGEGFETAPGAQAQLEIGADRLSLSGDTEIAVAALDAHSIDLRITRGGIGFRLARLGAGESVTIELPRGAARLRAPGNYEIAAGSAQQPSRLAVFTGRARFSGNGADLAVEPGRTAVLNGEKPVSAALQPAGNAPADADAKLPVPADVGANMTGVADLAAAGSWSQIAGLGAVWYPSGVPADWVPYRDGHWAWIEPWGWTWIDDRPWGFAPSHFGRWAEIGGKWGWLPGRKAADPIYAPALVAFIGTAGVGISYAGGHGPAIGWFPLAPGEIYWPSYTGDLGYIRALNRPDVANADTIRVGGRGKPPVEIVNWHFLNRLAASVVPRPAFAEGRPVALALLQLPQERLREAPAIMGSPRVTPAMVRALAPPPIVAQKKGAARVVRVAVAPQRRLAHASVATRLHRLAAKTRPAARPELRRHAAGAHFRVPAYARAEPKRLLIRARAVHAAAKPHPAVAVKFRMLHLPAKKKPAP